MTMDTSQTTTTSSQKILEKFDRESVTRNPGNQAVRILIACTAAFYSLFHLYITFYPMPTLLTRAIHVGVGAALIFLLYPPAKSSSRSKIIWFDWLWVAAALASMFYLIVQYQNIMTIRGGIPNTTDIVMAILTVIVVLEMGRRITGWILPIFALIFLSYPFYSHMRFVPDRLATRIYDLGDIFGQLYLKTEGLYSTAIGASVSFIFLFILFGAFLARSGMGQLFNDLALALAGSHQGGPAKVAVISSGFMGSINGSAVANVVGTGAFTIPLMKKIGYSRNFAGAVEASASIGGQILPPIMGASAFIMAETTGVKYSTIALAALIPALLYYFGVLAQVHFRAGKDDLKGVPKADLPRVKEVMKARGHMLIPIIALVVMLAKSIPIGYAAAYTIGITVLVSWIRPETRMGIKDIFAALQDGAKQSLSVMAACAVVGIVIGVVNLTSFGNVMTSLIVSLGSGSLFLTLILTMIASMILGMGLPSIPAYIITATMVAPALATFGVPVIVAHLFVFYFGIFANITPPVALASFAGAGIAGGDPMKTGFLSLKLALAGFIVPFMFVYNPDMLMLDTRDIVVTAREYAKPHWFNIASVAVTAFVGVTALSAALEGYFKTHIAVWQRILMAVGGLMLIIPETMTDIIGIVIVAALFALNIMRAKRESKIAVA